jgi:hypothetical protein
MLHSYLIYSLSGYRIPGWKFLSCGIAVELLIVSWHLVLKVRRPRPADFQFSDFISGVSSSYLKSFLFLETGSSCVAQAGLELQILLPLPPKTRDSSSSVF